MHITSHIKREVNVRLDAAEQFQYTGTPITVSGNKLFKAHIREINISTYDDHEEPHITIEGFGINANGLSAMVTRRYRIRLAEAQTLLPPFLRVQIEAALNALKVERVSL